MHRTFTDFIHGFYLNYWNEQCDPLIRPLIAEYLPSFLTNAGSWTAFLTEPPDESLVEQKAVSITFKVHPNWENHYEQVGFSLLLKIFQGKCIGIYTVQLFFSYPTEQSLQTAINDLVTECHQLATGLSISHTKNGFSVHSADSSVNAYFKTDYHIATQKHRLFFSTAPVFFSCD